MSSEPYTLQKELPMSTDLVEVKATHGDMMRLAIENGATAEALERIAAAVERSERWDAERAFNEAMCACQAELPGVARTAFNKQTSSYYAKLEDVGRAIDPVIHKHGFSQSFGTDDSHIPGYFRIVCDLRHSAGHCQRYKLDLPPDDKGMQGSVNKTMVHGIASTLSYGERYLTCMIFKVRLEGKDNDGNGASDAITEGQVRALEQLLVDTNSDIAKFCAAYAIQKITELPASQLTQAMTQVRRKLKQ